MLSVIWLALGSVSCEEENLVDESERLESQAGASSPTVSDQRSKPDEDDSLPGAADTEAMGNEDEEEEPHPVKILSSIKELKEIVELSQQGEEERPELFVVLVTNDHCLHCQEYEMTLFPQAKDLMVASILEQHKQDPNIPKFLQLDSSTIPESEEELQTQLGIGRVPALLLIQPPSPPKEVEEPSSSNNSNKKLLKFNVEYLKQGISDTPESLARGLLHFWYRIQHGGLSTISRHRLDFIQVGPVPFNSLQEVVDEAANGSLFSLNEALPTPLDPHLSQEEKSHIHYVMGYQDDEHNVVDPFFVVLQCRPLEETDQDLQDDLSLVYEEYALLANALVAKRNVLFGTLLECKAAGSVDIYSYTLTHHDESHSTSSLEELGTWDYDLEEHVMVELDDSEESRENLEEKAGTVISESLSRFLTMHLSPSVLWFDRQMTAPIAFIHSFHAVLFVDDHDWESSRDITKHFIQRFREACQQYRSSIMCMVVPSTETRVLTSFGVDIWSPLDPAACGNNKAAETEDRSQLDLLPSLLVTDQRSGGTRRFYMDLPHLQKEENAIVNFFGQVAAGNVGPEIKSATHETVNKSGVHVWVADNFWEHVKSDKHTIVMMYSPTCGHCKRLSVIFNQLAQTVKSMRWSKRIELAKVDVTQNEILDMEQPELLPELYYFGPASSAPVRFDVLDAFGDGAGRISDPLDILDWLLDVSDPKLDEQQLLDDLEAAERES